MTAKRNRTGGLGKGKGGASLQARRNYREEDPKNRPATDSGVRRLARRGGVKRLTAGIYNDARNNMRSFLRDIISDAMVYCKAARRKTISTKDVLAALQRRGRPLYGFAV